MFDVIRSTCFTLAALCTSSVIAATAAAETRAPLRASDQRTTTGTIDRYDRPIVVERVRSDLKSRASFSAEPQPIDPNAVLLFEITSDGLDGAQPRWRCVAVRDVAECLGNGVSIPYGPRDDKMVLRITAKPRHTRETAQLIAAHRAARDEMMATRAQLARAKAAPVADGSSVRR
ncbi:hypothetical protein L6R52_37495 [Myxococcota bacterium]|nr:hypothetical protein [Myxococcota bacterium]